MPMLQRNSGPPVLDANGRKHNLLVARAWADLHMAFEPADVRERVALSICGLIDGAWYRGAMVAEEVQWTR